MTWYAHVTVATVVVQNDRFLMVYENAEVGPVYNQPAGHLEENETLEEAALRETLEETGWQVELTGVLGIHLYKAPSNGVTYVRITFVAKPIAPPKDKHLDADIIESLWLTYEEVKARQTELRSPMVLSDIERYRSGDIQPMDLVTSIQVQ
jgi:ADP-ribose pyrophosphatase YjhB (NUDIX family)